MKEHKDVEDWREAFESGKFTLYFSDFLFHKDGAQEREKSFKFDGELVCNEPVPPIKVHNHRWREICLQRAYGFFLPNLSFHPQSSKLGKVNYAQFSGPEEHIPARSIVFGIIDDANFNSPTFSHAQVRSEPKLTPHSTFTNNIFLEKSVMTQHSVTGCNYQG